MTDHKLKEKFPNRKFYRGSTVPAFEYGGLEIPEFEFSDSDQELLDRSSAGENYSRILYALARKSISVGINTILEVGAGNSSLAFAHALRDIVIVHSPEDGVEKIPRIFSIEIDSNNPLSSVWGHVHDVLGIYWRIVHADSLKAPMDQLPPQVDLLFIDGDHGGEHAIGDYRKFSPLVRDGGLIVYDDYPIFSGPAAAVAILTAEGVVGKVLTYNKQDGNSFYVIQK